MPPPASFTPRIPLVLAETHVDFARINQHIERRREQVEQQIQPSVRRLALLIHMWDAQLLPASLIAEITGRLERALQATVRFGQREVRAELARLRGPTNVRAAYAIPDAGGHNWIAASGLPAVYAHVRDRADEAVRTIAAAANQAAGQPGLDPDERALLIAEAARRAAHNVVLELVGETLNLGRAAEAITMGSPPEFALRSEQLDRRTCDICTSVHGEIVAVGSPEFFHLMPPALCLGGGRCRGIYVYGDQPTQMVLRPAAA